MLINAKSCKKENDFFARYIFHLLVYVSLLILVNAQYCKQKTSFLQDIPFISMCFNNNTSKCTILQKRKRPFCEIFHLLVYVSILILVNAQFCKKENDFFARNSFY